jgi:HPt (histidine-containing phosphotransfer) domain-containing protein
MTSAPPAGPGPADTPAHPSGSGILDELQRIDGVDVAVAVGLAAVGGHEGVYGRLLARFIQTHEQDAATWLLDVSKADAAWLRKQAHRVQGAAATLGLINIDEGARRLGLALGDDAPAEDRAPLAAQLALALDGTLRALRAVPAVAAALAGLPPAAH